MALQRWRRRGNGGAIQYSPRRLLPAGTHAATQRRKGSFPLATAKSRIVVRTTVISMGSGVADAKGHVVFSSSKMLDKSGTLKAKHERKS